MSTEQTHSIAEFDSFLQVVTCSCGHKAFSLESLIAHREAVQARHVAVGSTE